MIKVETCAAASTSMVGLVWIICLPVWGRIGGTIIWGRIGGGGTIICQIYPKPFPPQLGNTGVDQFETQHSKGIKGTVLLLKRRYEEECAKLPPTSQSDKYNIPPPEM